MKRIFQWLLPCLLVSCSSAYYQAGHVSWQGYRLTAGSFADSSVQAMLAPYASNVNAKMTEVIGKCSAELTKAQPDGSLGCFITDAYLSEARKSFGEPVDLALMNDGGIRISSMAAGNITVGKIFELMPFDNVLVLQKLSGSVLHQLLDHVAAVGGWPVSGGTYNISQKKATDIIINGQPVDDQKMYSVVLSDYVANGGSDCSMLVGIPQQSKGYLQRDAILQYIRDIAAQGKNIEVPKMPRVKIIK